MPTAQQYKVSSSHEKVDEGALEDVLAIDPETRGVHRSVRVEFVPNPRPTCGTRVENVLTRHRLVKESDRSSQFCAGNTVGSVETAHGGKSSQNN